jgi:tetratricopeptide (TPR) repeat protein
MLHVLMVFIILIVAVAQVQADTLFLKDGRSIRCDAAREEGSVVRYWIGEAQLSISKDRVERIERGGEKGESLGGSSKSPGPSEASRLADLPSPALLPGEKPEQNATTLNADALDKLEANVRAEPGDDEQREKLISALNSAAYLEYEAGNYAKSKALLERVLKWEGKSSIALINLAAIELMEGRYSSALTHAKRAVEINPASQLAYYQLGAAYYALENVSEAVKAWRFALKIKEHPAIKAALDKAEREMAIARDFTSNRSRFFNISMEGGTINSTLESAILSQLEESYGQLKRRFEYEPNEKISVIFYTSDHFFNVTNAPAWAGAVNDGKLRVPVGGLDTVNDELSKTITHELTHSFIYFKARGKCPTWLNEGLAQIMEGKSASSYRASIAQLAEKGNLPSLQALSGSFMKLSTGQAALAYAYSLAATELLAESDLRSAIKVLEDLGQNYNISAALSRHTRFRDLDAFEKELKRRVSQ